MPSRRKTRGRPKNGFTARRHARSARNPSRPAFRCLDPAASLCGQATSACWNPDQVSVYTAN